MDDQLKLGLGAALFGALFALLQLAVPGMPTIIDVLGMLVGFGCAAWCLWSWWRTRQARR